MGFDRAGACALWLLPLPLLLSCREGAEIMIDQPAGGGVIVSVEKAGGERPCVYSVVIGRESDGPSADDWIVQLDEGARPACTNRFAWPDVPAGYHLAKPAKPLKAGETYRVTIAGPGIGEDRTFVRGSGSGG